MVQLRASQDPDTSPDASRCSEEVGKKQECLRLDSSPRSIPSLQFALSVSTTPYPGYETYIEDGLICLKHKIRNIEKKKLKLEDYKRRLKNGDQLNQDQLDAIERYDEVVHNLSFAKELHKTLGALTQDLLRAQRKAEKREQVVKMERERQRLCMVLKMQYLLQTLQHEHIRQGILTSSKRPHSISAQDVEVLRDLGALLLGHKGEENTSLEDRMMQASVVYWELLEGVEKPVVGSTYKIMKGWLSKLLECGFFDNLVIWDDQEEPKVHSRQGLAALMKFRRNEVQTREFLNRHSVPDESRAKCSVTNAPAHNWKEEFLALKDQEPPDSWDMELEDIAPAPKAPLQKPVKGAASFILKDPNVMKKANIDIKPKSQRKAKPGLDVKPVLQTESTLEVFNSPSALAKDPFLRKRELEDLMGKISGSFSFMQDSLLDGEVPTKQASPRVSAPPVPSTPPVRGEFKDTPASVSSNALHSTPLSSKLTAKEGNGKLTNGNQSFDDWDPDASSMEIKERPQTAIEGSFQSPPLFRHKSSISLTPEKLTLEMQQESPPPGVEGNSSTTRSFSTPPSQRSPPLISTAPSQNMHPVYKVAVPTSLCSGSYLKPFGSTTTENSTVRHTSASTQTPPELNLPEEEHLEPDGAIQPEFVVRGGPMYPLGHMGQPYPLRGSARGMGRAGRARANYFRSPGGPRGFDGYRSSPRSSGVFTPHSHPTREATSTPISLRENGHQPNYRHGSNTGQRNNSSVGWSDSSQVSSPDRDGAYLVDLGDSGHGDSLSEIPVTPQSGPALMPIHVYPMPQQARVAFSAARTFNFAPGTLDQPIVFDQLHSNVGEMFDMGSGRFTCPVSGTYVFIFHILKLAVNVPLYINLMRNEEVLVSGYANDGAPDHETASNHAVLQLFQGDQMWLRLHRGAIYGSSWKYSTFSGFLLYQD